TVDFAKGKKRLNVQIFVDKSTVEVFINGEATTSNLAYNLPQDDGIAFVSDGEVTVSVVKHDVAL
ncbi:MAG: GH32 C-terminal domain-containing protein, partial [Candidatus Fimimonas sp.]